MSRENAALDIDSGGRPIILVPGQVEDDASIQRGSPAMKRNIDLLRAVRQRNRDAFVIYKPHPDVEAGFRKGRVSEGDAVALADRVVRGVSIVGLIAICDRMETMTSLAGFEALIRGKPVTTHGQPFYAGWGLTEDLSPVARRKRRATLDELVAATLLLYPRYVDPLSGLVCTPELLVDRLTEATAARPTAAGRLLRAGRTAVARTLYASQVVKEMTRR